MTSSDRPQRRPLDPWQLGGTLYVPAMHHDLTQILAGRKLQEPRSLVVCLEDAVNEQDVPEAIDRLALALQQAQRNEQVRFVRARNPGVLGQVLALPGIERMDGFVLPKITDRNVQAYLDLLTPEQPFWLLPTLETAEVFDEKAMQALRDHLVPHQDRILTLRVGGNDLLNTLGIRRPKSGTIYDTPVAFAIARLVQLFKPEGFSLSAPVFEYLDRMELLEEEVRQDMMYGLTGKTAIHPHQIASIESHYRVHQHDVEAADAILAPDAPAVFKLHGSMCEPATHRRWAQQIQVRMRVYGLSG